MLNSDWSSDVCASDLKDRVPIEVAIGDDRFAVAVPRTGGHGAPDCEDFAPAATHDLLDAVRVPLIKLALARSGDKGDHANIGVIARKPKYLPWIETALSVDALRDRKRVL